jgi:uncharacterized protein YwgA
MEPNSRELRRVDRRADRNWRKLLLLYLIGKTHEMSFLNRTKFQKLVFMSQVTMKYDALDGFDYEFIRYRYGPFSQGLCIDRNALHKSGFITDPTSHILTPEGVALLKSAEPLLLANKAIVEAIDRTIEEYGGQTAASLVEIMYDLDVLSSERKPMKMRDLPPETVLSIPHAKGRRKIGRQISEAWEETLELLFDRQARRSLEIGLESVRKWGSRPYAGSS